MKNTTAKKKLRQESVFSKYCNSVTFAMVTPGTFPFNILTVPASATVVERYFTLFHLFNWIRQTTRRPSRRSDDRGEIVKADL